MRQKAQAGERLLLQLRSDHHHGEEVESNIAVIEGDEVGQAGSHTSLT